MNAAIKKEWLADLRSGEIKQGMGALHKLDGSCCCLGVLCRIAERHGIVSKKVLPHHIYQYIGDGSFNSATLPQAVATWAGITEHGQLKTPIKMRPEHHGVATDLCTLNDRGFTFAQIADVIEKQF